MDDEPGYLSDVLKIIAEYQANILTIHQSIPINGIASLSISIQILKDTGDVSGMLEQMEGHRGVHHVKILAKE
jgi:chorismate mutase